MRAIAVTAIALLAISSPLLAQNTDIEALSGLQFNFGNPGARSLGMGGAFMALADDASAAEANPAGLTILRKAEISIEGRRTTIGQTFVTGGTYPYVNTTEFASARNAISFASAVIPSHGAVVALYYHRSLSFRNRVDVTQRYDMPVYFVGPAGPVAREQCATTPGCQQRQIYPFSTSADVQMETFGIAAAHQWRTVSVGAAMRYHRFQEAADTLRRDVDAPDKPVFVVAQTNSGRFFGDSTNKAVSFVGGVKWTPSPRLSLGAVFKQDSSFAAPVSAGSAGGAQTPIATTRFHVPAMAGVGLAFRPAPALTVTADAMHVSYSHLTDSFVSVIEYGTSTGGVERVSGYTAKNVTELHAGLEYFVLTRAPVAIRAGWWRDPAHAITYRGPVVSPEEVAAHILFPGGRAENHFSAGIGVAWPRFQIDAAYDTSRTLKTASVSIIARY